MSKIVPVRPSLLYTDNRRIGSVTRDESYPRRCILSPMRSDPMVTLRVYYIDV